jgi:aspartyl-tRNA(Asn)/glutamyl-tRNA(Gln) amidotransferase subunit C
MSTPDEVTKLAALARIDVSEEDVQTFAKEFDAILAYVGKIEALSVSGEADTRPVVRNVMRKDAGAHEAAEYTKRLVAQFPEQDENYLKVKKIISHD